MALYTKKLSIPANTPEDSPVTTSFTIEETLITKMEVGFPDGCANMVGIRIFYGIKRFWPENPDTPLYGNDEIVSWREHQRLPEKYSTLTVYGFSPGTDYDHEILIRIFTLPELVAAPGIIMRKLYKFFKRIF